MIISNKNICVGYEERTNGNQKNTQNWYINQCGYDIGKSKRATFSNGTRGDIFYLKKYNTDEVVF